MVLILYGNRTSCRRVTCQGKADWFYSNQLDQKTGNGIEKKEVKAK
jgi:hypothetical protein